MSFVIQHINNVSRIFKIFQISFYIYPLKWRISGQKFELRVFISNAFYLKLKKYFCVFASFFKFSTQVVIYHNVLLTLSKIVQINFEIDNNDSTLFNAVNLNFDVRKVVSTLTWRSLASWRLINQIIALKQRGNVCWGKISYKYTT